MLPTCQCDVQGTERLLSVVPALPLHDRVHDLQDALDGKQWGDAVAIQDDDGTASARANDCSIMIAETDPADPSACEQQFENAFVTHGLKHICDNVLSDILRSMPQSPSSNNPEMNQ